jgi:hypothetical protein
MAIRSGAATLLIVLSGSFAIAGSGVAYGQTTSPDTVIGYELLVYQPGIDPATGPPAWRSSIAASAVTCNREPAVTPPIIINPTTVSWSDPAHQGRICLAKQLQFLQSLPVVEGPYLATLTALTAGSRSLPSAPSNVFFRWARSGDPVGIAVPRP